MWVQTCVFLLSGKSVLLVGNLHSIGIRPSSGLPTRDVSTPREEGIAYHHSLQRLSFTQAKGKSMSGLI